MMRANTELDTNFFFTLDVGCDALSLKYDVRISVAKRSSLSAAPKFQTFDSHNLSRNIAQVTFGTVHEVRERF